MKDGKKEEYMAIGIILGIDLLVLIGVSLWYWSTLKH